MTPTTTWTAKQYIDQDLNSSRNCSVMWCKHKCILPAAREETFNFWRGVSSGIQIRPAAGPMPILSGFKLNTGFSQVMQWPRALARFQLNISWHFKSHRAGPGGTDSDWLAAWPWSAGATFQVSLCRAWRYWIGLAGRLALKRWRCCCSLGPVFPPGAPYVPPAKPGLCWQGPALSLTAAWAWHWSLKSHSASLHTITCHYTRQSSITCALHVNYMTKSITCQLHEYYML